MNRGTFVCFSMLIICTDRLHDGDMKSDVFRSVTKNRSLASRGDPRQGLILWAVRRFFSVSGTWIVFRLHANGFSSYRTSVCFGVFAMAKIFYP